MKTEKGKRKISPLAACIWALGITFVLVTVVYLAMAAHRGDPVAAAEAEAARTSLCAIDPEGTIERTLIYKIEKNHYVYVEPMWYDMPLDQKRGATAYIAQCKLGGTARILDARSGRLLARWGMNGYVAY